MNSAGRGGSEWKSFSPACTPSSPVDETLRGLFCGDLPMIDAVTSAE